MSYSTINKEQVLNIEPGSIPIIIFDYDNTLAPHYNITTDFNDYISQINSNDIYILESFLYNQVNAGTIIVIISNNYKHIISKVLDYFNLGHYISEIIGGDYKRVSKIDRINYVLYNYNKKPEDVSFIDDSPFHIKNDAITQVRMYLYIGNTLLNFYN